MSNLIEEFFDSNQPCPDKVPNCQELRKQYQHDIQLAQSNNCIPCAITKIKVKYMEIVWKAFIDSLN